MQQTDESSAFTPAAASRQSTDVLQPGDRVMIHAVGVSENDPIAREYVIEPNGSVALGPTYGRVQIAGLSAEQAERAIVAQLERMFRSAKVQITHAGGAVRQTELESLREDVRALRALLEGMGRQPQSVGPTSPSLRPGR
jgi:protein involved in polysaccharide export with SLBB domain